MIEKAGSIFFDFSRSKIPDSAFEDFLVGEKPRIANFFDQMISGAPVNNTESRSALHFSTRRTHPSFQNVSDQMKNMFSFVEAFHQGDKIEFKNIRNVINVGIGGSHLGPEMLFRALSVSYPNILETRFISNLDPVSFQRGTKDLLPAETLVIFCSKTFSTLETLANLELFIEWFNTSGTSPFDYSFAVTANAKAAAALGFKSSNIFEFDVNIGGRFSVTSPVGLVLALSFGTKVFQEMLNGCARIDSIVSKESTQSKIFYRHVFEYIGNKRFLQSNTIAVLPYCEALDRFPDYLQQLFMESLGKSVDIHGNLVSEAGPVVIGEVGTSAQHSFMQYLHQGLDTIPAEFIIVKPAKDKFYSINRQLALNAIAQANALSDGDRNAAIAADGSINSHKVIPGNRPSTLLILQDLSAESLGQLVAWYENLVIALGASWNINPFDQFGVELGKRLARELDGSTDQIVDPDMRSILDILEI